MPGQNPKEILQPYARAPADEKVHVVSANRLAINADAKALRGRARDFKNELTMATESSPTGGEIGLQGDMNRRRRREHATRAPRTDRKATAVFFS